MVWLTFHQRRNNFIKCMMLCLIRGERSLSYVNLLLRRRLNNVDMAINAPDTSYIYELSMRRLGIIRMGVYAVHLTDICWLVHLRKDGKMRLVVKSSVSVKV